MVSAYRGPASALTRAPPLEPGHTGAMVVVFEGLVWTSYAQLYLTTGRLEPPLPDEAFVGQANGLCGAAVTGTLFMVTGTHTGGIPVRVVVHDAAPEVGAWSEVVEVVEVSLVPDGAQAILLGWGSDPSVRFALHGACYRARWSGSGMDEGRAHDVADASHPAADHYELALWPAPASADAIVRRTGATASYWHDSGFTRR